MTPTERAREALKVLGLGCWPPRVCDEEPCACEMDRQHLADHIRRAENGALERVAAYLDTTRYSSALAANVRAMKHEVEG